jgi:hypothetical protein
VVAGAPPRRIAVQSRRRTEWMAFLFLQGSGSATRVGSWSSGPVVVLNIFLFYIYRILP